MNPRRNSNFSSSTLNHLKRTTKKLTNQGTHNRVSKLLLTHQRAMRTKLNKLNHVTLKLVGQKIWRPQKIAIRRTAEYLKWKLQIIQEKKPQEFSGWLRTQKMLPTQPRMYQVMSKHLVNPRKAQGLLKNPRCSYSLLTRMVAQKPGNLQKETFQQIATRTAVDNLRQRL